MNEPGALSPFHEGEREVQTRLGVRDQIEKLGQKVIRHWLTDEHRDFFSQLPYLFLASVDETGRPWASVVAGRPGFIQTPDAHTLRIAAPRIDGDPLNRNLVLGGAIGGLGVQYETRRRNRFTARVSRFDSDHLELEINQSFGNCPQYIQVRVPALSPEIDDVGAEKPKTPIRNLTGRAAHIISHADNFYIATHYSAQVSDVANGADVSHRGGRPGFVCIDDDINLTFPDFTGNFHFNTIGNLTLNPRAGLLFVDFESGDLLYLIGTATVIWDGEAKRAFDGAERLVRFTLDEGLLVEHAMPIRWHFVDYSPSLEKTGTWEEVAETLAARRASNVYHDLTVMRVERESDVITSFYLQPENGESIHCHLAGQFLPIELQPPGHDKPVRRTYTISNAPNGSYYRLSIKREPSTDPALPPGASSNYFHDHVKPGDTLRALSPRGQFVLARSGVRPVVLLSAGVGITPMISMLEQLAEERMSCGRERNVWFIHGARSGKEHAFGDHVRRIAHDWPSLNLHFVYSEPQKADVAGSHYDTLGWVDTDLLKTLLPFDDYDFYLCGPPPFMESLYSGLKTLNVPDDRIHYEFFGPGASLLQSTSDAAVRLVGDMESQPPVKVRFAKSGKEAVWDATKGTLLDLAEAQGLRPAYSCRSGICATCSTRLLAGDVAYVDPPLAEAEQGHALICCSYPDASNRADGLVLDL